MGEIFTIGNKIISVSPTSVSFSATLNYIIEEYYFDGDITPFKERIIVPKFVFEKKSQVRVSPNPVYKALNIDYGFYVSVQLLFDSLDYNR